MRSELLDRGDGNPPLLTGGALRISADQVTGGIHFVEQFISGRIVA
jgi:hypothetical protein